MSNNIKSETVFIIKPNPNKDAFKTISDAIKDNDNYCCCEIEKNDNTLCMCKNFREQNESGFCHCGRYLKINDLPTVTILHHPADTEAAEHYADTLSRQGIVVLTPRFCDEFWYHKNQTILDEVVRTQIYKSDAVFVMNTNQNAQNFLEDFIYWAEELGKKIIYENMEEVEQNED